MVAPVPELGGYELGAFGIPSFRFREIACARFCGTTFSCEGLLIDSDHGMSLGQVVRSSIVAGCL